MSSRSTFLIDGNNLLYRSAYAVGKDQEPCFDHTCISHFLKSVRNALFRFTADKCFMVWDGGRSQRRFKLFGEYKALRSSNHRAKLLRMIFRLTPIFHKLKCRSVCLVNREADDVIAILVKKIGGGTIVSSDKDMLQLVRRGATIYCHTTGSYVSGEFFRKSVGIDQSQYLLVKAIAGDVSDSIPGVKGIGKKTATQILEKAEDHSGFSIQNAYDLFRAIENIPKSKRGKRESWILENKHLIRRNVSLMDLEAELFTDSELDGIRRVMESPVKFDVGVISDLKRYRVFDLVGQFDTWSVPFRRLV